MNKYSVASAAQLATCVSEIQQVFKRVLRDFDHTILEGYRGEKKQHKAFLDKKSKVDWPDSNHNKFPSVAVDAMPFPFSFADLEGKNGAKRQILAICRQYLFIGTVLATASMMGIKMRNGGDWDMDTDLSDQKFNDLPHFELVV